jgi:methylated-DNA-[protein]-cysteine S-methyltransferase
MSLHECSVETPIGELEIFSADRGVIALQPKDGAARAHVERHFGAREGRGDPHGAAKRLEAYFAGELHALDDLALDLRGTPFQLEVWRALRAIGPSETRSYGALATVIGKPSASRAVGLANGRNPVMIVVPCHRVIGADGSLTGYAGGLERKDWLLRHERRFAKSTSSELARVPQQHLEASGTA